MTGSISYQMGLCPSSPSYPPPLPLEPAFPASWAPPPVNRSLRREKTDEHQAEKTDSETKSTAKHWIHLISPGIHQYIYIRKIIHKYIYKWDLTATGDWAGYLSSNRLGLRVTWTYSTAHPIWDKNIQKPSILPSPWQWETSSISLESCENLVAW